ncbi:hypothetical protein Egran_01339 [Elaphomyces granulatus]|uniref:Dihydrofolate reductase n=1 Tax=Elaphomyces granulatus TaxID=519963 RepID=A0A232M3A6_9EURO|nr:hypothetical protein Egran_01339 [Elaphomyces granulatus]
MPSQPPAPLTLIVATTPIRSIPPPSPSSKIIPSGARRLGIGINGTLPWRRIKSDMSFFVRVTTRAPRRGATNAVIMGRKTYDSIPQHLRPLDKRINVVVTRDATGSVGSKVAAELEKTRKEKKKKETETAPATIPSETGKDNLNNVEPTTDAVVSSSLESALSTLESYYYAVDETPKNENDKDKQVRNVFVIGGAEIYAAALRLPPSSPFGQKLRILMTKVIKRRRGRKHNDDADTDVDVELGPEEGGEEEEGEEGFECDTFFPVDEMTLLENGWREVPTDEVTGWVGEKVSPDWKEEGDVAIKMVGYERVS